MVNYLEFQQFLKGGQIRKFSIGGFGFEATRNYIKDLVRDPYTPQYQQQQTKETPIPTEENTSDGWDDISGDNSTPTAKVTNFSGDKGAFVKELSDAYTAAGITNPEVQKTLIAQDALETGWGKHMAGAHNYGNITAGSSWKGATTVRKDNQNGKNYTFRSYNSTNEYIRDKIRLLQNSYDIVNSDSADDVIAKLNGQNHKGYKYAEDPHYRSSLSNMYKSISGYFG